MYSINCLFSQNLGSFLTEAFRNCCSRYFTDWIVMTVYTCSISLHYVINWHSYYVYQDLFVISCL